MIKLKNTPISIHLPELKVAFQMLLVCLNVSYKALTSHLFPSVSSELYQEDVGVVVFVVAQPNLPPGFPPEYKVSFA